MKILQLFALCIILQLSFSNKALCQTNKDVGWLAVESDPLTTLFGAKTISIIIEPQKMGHWSIFTNIVSADFPDWMDDLLNPKNKGKDFDSEISIGGGVAVDYFFKLERKGYYVGLINLFFSNKVKSQEFSKKILTHNVIPRIGYRWYPFPNSKFYLNPFLGFRYEFAYDNDLFVGNEKFSPAGLQPFGTIHIGYHF